MAKTPLEVFKAFKDASLLEKIAEQRQIELTDKTKKSLAKFIAEDVSKVGLRQLLKILKVETLKGLATGIEEEKQKSVAKNVLVKRIYDALDEDPKKYLESLDAKYLKPVCEELELEGGSKAKQIEQILQEASETGLDHCFSSFPVNVLQVFAVSCGLVVQTQSKEKIVQALIEQTDLKKKKKAKKKT